MVVIIYIYLKPFINNYYSYTLRGKLEKDDDNEKRCKLYFELEVCVIPSPAGNATNSAPLVVVRRKRLKGDAWCYKKICEEVLSLTVRDS